VDTIDSATIFSRP